MRAAGYNVSILAFCPSVLLHARWLSGSRPCVRVPQGMMSRSSRPTNRKTSGGAGAHGGWVIGRKNNANLPSGPVLYSSHFHGGCASGVGAQRNLRYYAIVDTADGKGVNELLVAAGLAQIHGTRTPLPDGRDSREYLAHFARPTKRTESSETWCMGQRVPLPLAPGKLEIVLNHPSMIKSGALFFLSDRSPPLFFLNVVEHWEMQWPERIGP